MSLKRKFSEPKPIGYVYEIHDNSIGNYNPVVVGTFEAYEDAREMAKKYFETELVKVLATNLAFGEVIYDLNDIMVVVVQRYKFL